MEERRKGDTDDEVTTTIKEVKLLKQDITMMKDTLASDMTALEGTTPNRREIERMLLMELDESLLEINRNVQGMDRGL
eukprot:5886010-Prorocentrum_lima.AAC.1